MDAIECIMTRCSIRKYEKKDIPEDVLTTILECGHRAPSASNRQPWEFIVIKDDKKKERICDLGAKAIHERKGVDLKSISERFMRIACASVFIVIAVDKTKSNTFYIQDGSAAAQNMLLCAHALGLGGVWLGAPHSLKKYDEEIKRMTKIGENFIIASIIAIGYPAEKRKISSRVPLHQKVHKEIYGERNEGA